MKDAYYFPHFSNARNDRKLKRVIKTLGVEGYGIYFMLLEVLRDQNDFCYPISDIDLLADEFGTSEAKVTAVIRNFELFNIDEEHRFFSINLIRYLEPMFKMRQQRIEAGKASGKARKGRAELNDRSTTVQRMLNENEQRKGKENKGEENKENKRIVNESSYARPHASNDPELIDFFINNGSTASEASNYYNYYHSQGWLKSNHMPVSDWRSVAYSWIQRSLHDPRYKPKAEKKIIMTPDFSHLEND
jgi:hypothetical protein